MKKGSYKTAIVTGATGQIGGAIAEVLLKAGFHVSLFSRDRKRTMQLIDKLSNSSTPNDLSYHILDLSEKRNVFQLARTWIEPIHILINNAACTPRVRMENKEGIELQWATNVLGYFWMIEAFTPFFQAGTRIINVASYWAGGLNIKDPEFKVRIYENGSAYRQSKQADRMLSAAYSDRFASKKILVNACHPGDVNSTLSNNLGFGGHETPAEGASTPLFLAIDSSLDGVSGYYFEHKQKVPCSFMENRSEVEKLYDLCKSY